MCLHNGYIKQFKEKVKANFHACLSPAVQSGIQGNTDSEYLFALFRHERLLHKVYPDSRLRILYAPEYMPRNRRAMELPRFDSLCRWARQIQSENLELLSEVLSSAHYEPLLRKNYLIHYPEYWQAVGQGAFSLIDATGRRPLPLNEPVYGISHFEALAYARWADARLPHEYEWEAAKKNGALTDDGHVWEWCANPFHPYTGFSAFPYKGYSIPWFDNRHFTLCGRSDYTRTCVRRPGFRNFYQADKRHIRAGLRLVFTR